MMFAAQYGHRPIVELLVDHGANVFQKASVSHTLGSGVHNLYIVHHSHKLLTTYTGLTRCPSPCCLWWFH